MSIEIVRTIDADLLSEIISHPAIYPMIASDHAGPAAEFSIRRAVFDRCNYFLLIFDDGELCGGMLFDVQNSVMADVHVFLLPEARGKKAIKYTRACFTWMTDNTRIQKFIAHISVLNKPSYVFAKWVGFKLHGINTKSFLKGGQLVDQYFLGLEKEDMSSWQE